MSRERALRRARQAEERARRAAQADRRDARAVRRRARNRIVLDALPTRGRRQRGHGQRGRLAARRRLQNGIIALLFFAVLLVLWLLADSWWARLGGTVLAILALPVFVTLALDRRSGP